MENFNCTKCGEIERPQSWANALQLWASKLCFSCHFWSHHLREFLSNQNVVVNGNNFYYVGRVGEKGQRGFGGRPFVIIFSDGTRVRTANLWLVGEIPVRFRNSIQNNVKELRSPATQEEWNAFSDIRK